MNRALPDIELAVITRLRAVLDGVTVGTTLGTARPAVTVDIAGGAPLVEGVLDEPRVTVDGWAATRIAALQACTAAVAALVTVSGSDRGWSAAGVQITRCSTVMRPTYLFDPVAQLPRYTATVALACRTAITA